MQQVPVHARSSAKVIRHAVAIDERRAKFRQDLISEMKPNHAHHYHHRRPHFRDIFMESRDQEDGPGAEQRGRRASQDARWNPSSRRATLAVPERHQSRQISPNTRKLSPAGLSIARSEAGPSTAASSMVSSAALQHYDSDSDGQSEQDIQEVWFAGCHAVRVLLH